MSTNQQALLMAGGGGSAPPVATCIADPYYNGPNGDPYFASVVLLLHFDGGYTDNSSFTNSLTNSGCAINTTVKKFGSGALQANGSTPGGGGANVVYTASSLTFDVTSSDFTVEAFAYLNSGVTALYSTIFRLQNSLGITRLTYAIRDVSDLEIFVVDAAGSTTNFRTSTDPFTLNAWHHVAITRSGTTVRVFLDGTVLFTGTISVPASDATRVMIGNQAISGGTTGWDGYIDEVRVTKGIARYTGNFVIPTSAYPDASPVIAGDSDFSKVQLLLNFEGTNGSQTIVDRSFYARVPTAVNQPTISTTQKKFGNSSLIRNAGSSLKYGANYAPIFPSGTDFTIEFWVWYPSGSTTTYFTVAAANAGSTGRFAIGIGNTSMRFAFWYEGSPLITDTNAAATDAWHSVCVTRSGTTTRLFRNGLVVGTISGDTRNYNSAGIGFSVFGSDATELPPPIGTYVDELRVTSGLARYTADYSVQTAAFPGFDPALTVLGLHCESAVDSSSQPKTVTLGGTASYVAGQGVYGTSALSVVSTGGITANGLTVPTYQDFQFGSGDWTIECWAKRTSQSILGYLFSVLTNQFTVVAVATTGQLNWTLFTSGGNIGTRTPSFFFSTNTYIHFVVQRNAGNVELYGNGTLIDTVAVPGGALSTINWTTQLNIGRGDATSAQNWTGYIDDVRITKGVARYNGTFTPPTLTFCDSTSPSYTGSVSGTGPLVGQGATSAQGTVRVANPWVKLSGQAATAAAGSVAPVQPNRSLALVGSAASAAAGNLVFFNKNAALTRSTATVSAGRVSVAPYPNLTGITTSDINDYDTPTATITLILYPDGRLTFTSSRGIVWVNSNWIDTSNTNFNISSISGQYQVTGVGLFVYGGGLSYPTLPYNLSNPFVLTVTSPAFTTTVFDFQVAFGPTSTNPRASDLSYYGTARLKGNLTSGSAP